MDWKGSDSFLVPRAPNIPYFRYIVHKMSLHQLIDMIASIEPAQQPRENGCTAEISPAPSWSAFPKMPNFEGQNGKANKTK